MRDRAAALREIAVGDIFHASAPNGASFPCLTLVVREGTIFARRMTSQSVHEFDRQTGVETIDGVPITIDSVAPLPADIQDIMLSIDRKYHEEEQRRAGDPDWIAPRETMVLTKEQQRALLFIGEFYRSNPV